MKIHWKDKFKEDYERHEKKLKSSASLRKALFRAISMLQQGKDLSEDYTVNRLLTQGQGWYGVYLFEDVIMIYKIQRQYVSLSRLGTAKELRKQG